MSTADTVQDLTQSVQSVSYSPLLRHHGVLSTNVKQTTQGSLEKKPQSTVQAYNGQR